MRHTIISGISVLVLLFAAAFQPGCATFSNHDSLPKLAPGTPQCRVQLRGEGWGKPVERTIAVDQNTRISTVVEATKASQKFRAMEVNVIRRVDGEALPLQMKIKHRGASEIPPHQDYALRPDDQVVITQLTETPLDKIVDNFLPFNNQQ